MKHFPYLLLAVIFFLNTNPVVAQDEANRIYPRVQHLTQKGQAFDFNGFKLEKASKWSALVRRTPVKKLMADKSDAGLPLILGLKKKIAATQDKDNLAKAEGAYDLTFHKNKVTLFAPDSVGIFYGLQSLSQLVENGKIFPVEISDFPTVKYRGVVEGFYGTPWSQADRISQLKFYGSIKANTYIYGPKDDPYHSSPNWRKPYPPDQAADIEKLVKVAHANFVDFVWAIHPGQDIKWDKEDRLNVLHKFEDMYQLGVRSFAVFFDDISGIGTDAHKQAALLNYLTDHFVKVKKDVKPLILTPTDYNKSWANPSLENGYLAILGRELEPSTQIMWTGDQVMSDVTDSTLEWVQKRIQRPALFWWNFPVSDYARDQLFIGPSYGLGKGVNAQEMSGILSNPMEHAEASKPAIFGVADYAWNTSAYNAEKSWEQCLKDLLPHSYKAYALFGENNSSPNHGITSYVGRESQTIAPYLKRIEDGLKNNEVEKSNMIFAEGYFYNIRQAAGKIETADDDTLLLAEVKPWLSSFTQLGQEGLNQLENYKYQDLNPREYWDHIITRLQKSDFWNPPSTKAGDGKKITPVTGTAVLRPFIQRLENWNNQKLMTKITGLNGSEKDTLSIGKIVTNIAAQKDTKITVVNDNEISVRFSHRPFKPEQGGYLTIQFIAPLKQATIGLDIQESKAPELQLEVSDNGKDWKKLTLEKKDNQMEAQVPKEFCQIRLSKNDSEEVSFNMSKLTVKTESGNGEEPFTTHDFDIKTFYSLTPGGSLTEKSLLVKDPGEAVILTNSDTAELQIKVKKDGTWEPLTQNYKGKYIEITLPKGVSEIRASTDRPVHIHEVLWKE